MIPPTIHNTDDTIDSRDIERRIGYLEGDDELEEDEKAELSSLLALRAEGESSGDWEYGATLIHDSYFQEYARQFADDIGAINRDDQWPYTCIDWDAAALDLQTDYWTVDFDGETYWLR